MNKKIKICYIVDDITGIFPKRWLSYFAQNKNYELYAITETKSKLKGVQVNPIKKSKIHIPKFSFISYVGQILKILDKIKPDLIHAHFLTGLNYALPFINKKYKVMLTVWGSDILIYPKKNPLLWYFTKKSLSRADLVTGNSKNLLTACEDLLEKHSRNLHLINWGVDEKIFKNKNKKILPNKILAKHFPIITHTRGLTPIYNVNNLLLAINKVKNVYPKLLLLMCHLGDGYLRPKLMQKIKTLDLTENVLFLDNITYAKMPQFLNCGDLAASIPLSDAGGESNIEAIACKLPLVLSSIPAYQGLYHHKKNAYFVDHKEPSQIANGIINIAQDEKLRNKLIHNSQVILKTYGYFTKNMKKVDYLYKSLVS
ncbi:glycosyltransferase family 4 protein [Candidatus Margulisiibacteriota bacterium]